MRQHLLRVILAILFVLGGISLFATAQADSDGDGVPDSNDSCVNRGNEGGLGIDDTGCPYYDADGDGVFDRNDACPRRADEYGFGVGNDGCPLSAPISPPNDDPETTPEPSDNPTQTEEPTSTEEPQATDEPLNPRDATRDADGDGIPDADDACPWQGNEGGLGIDDTGCPYYDTDGDGFFDRDDACPWRGNEGGLGVDDTGCPYYDADWDGFFDRDDECPWRADEYGFGVDSVGCPCEDAACGDADDDGIADEDDNCPAIPNPYQNDFDNDGIGDACDEGDSSTFDEDDEDWSTSGDATALRWEELGGNPGGAVCADDISTGIYWYFRTPYSGDLSSVYGLTLRYDLQSTLLSGSPGSPTDDIVISGNGITLAYQTGIIPPTDGTWATFNIPLSETGWVIQGTATPATMLDMQTVLTAVDYLDIAGEYVVGGDTGCIDNVVIE